ncbi:MAG TPA: hypothetical protein VLC72_01790 [Nitrosopumilaceae archaeon]|nr:hypothetical protein [Nitrosopumilaceae archaeon]
MPKTSYEKKIIVLKKNMEEDDARTIVEEKKASILGSALRKPKKDEVHIHSLTLYYEAILMVSGKYTANFFRKANHEISVDYNVNEVVLGDGVFPIRKKSGFAKALSKKSKNKVDLPLEEHVYIEEEGEIYFDHHGQEIRFPFKINSKIVENYPNKVLENNEKNVKRPEITYETAIEMLSTKLQKPVEPDVRGLKDELIIKEISEVYVPIYEARLVGPHKKVRLLRLDAIRKKIL